MTFTSPTDDIIVQEGTFAYNYIASGSIKAGQCLEAGTTSAMNVEIAEDATDAFVGVAAYDATNGEPLAVYGPGNIVRCIVNGTSKCTVGDDIMVSGSEGKVSNTGLAVGTKIGVALETQATTDGTVRILLV